jgi:hypothetical protein
MSKCAYSYLDLKHALFVGVSMSTASCCMHLGISRHGVCCLARMHMGMLERIALNIEEYRADHCLSSNSTALTFPPYILVHANPSPSRFRSAFRLDSLRSAPAPTYITHSASTGPASPPTYQCLQLSLDLDLLTLAIFARLTFPTSPNVSSALLLVPEFPCVYVHREPHIALLTSETLGYRRMTHVPFAPKYSTNRPIFAAPPLFPSTTHIPGLCVLQPTGHRHVVQHYIIDHPFNTHRTTHPPHHTKLDIVVSTSASPRCSVDCSFHRLLPALRPCFNPSRLAQNRNKDISLRFVATW